VASIAAGGNGGLLGIGDNGGCKTPCGKKCVFRGDGCVGVTGVAVINTGPRASGGIEGANERWVITDDWLIDRFMGRRMKAE
jgi:hypothetical protein